MVELLGEETVSLEEFSEILDAGFDEAKVGIIRRGLTRSRWEILREAAWRM